MEKKFKILVCGGRNYRDWDTLVAQLDTLQPISCIVNGGAGGADEMAADYAHERSIMCYTHHAKWSEYGRRAGPVRNRQMLDLHPDLDMVVAFPGGKGTADMVKAADERKILVWDLRVENSPANTKT